MYSRTNLSRQRLGNWCLAENCISLDFLFAKISGMRQDSLGFTAISAAVLESSDDFGMWKVVLEQSTFLTHTDCRGNFETLR